METKPEIQTLPQTLAGLDFVTWHLLGYEEFRAGWNQLLEQRRLVLLDAYLAALNTVIYQYQHTPGQAYNSWHLGGVDDGLMHVEARAEIQPLPNYREYDGCYSAFELSGQCDYCGKLFGREQGCLAQDMVQDHAFCSRECAKTHRHQLFELIPQLQQFYKAPLSGGPYPTLQVHTAWYLRPLPYTEKGLRTYLDNLPRPDLTELHPIDWSQWKPKPFTPRLKS